MRIYHLTLFPMLIIAVLTVIVGERMARREVEELVPADRERLLDFTSDFEMELERLDALYLSHLDELANRYFTDGRDELKDNARKLSGLKSMYLFSDKKRIDTFDFLNASRSYPLPKVSVEGQGRPLSLRWAVIIPLKVMNTETVSSGWIPAPDGKHIVYWTRVASKRLAAVVVDKDELNEINEAHFKSWLGIPLTPLRESATHFSIASPDGELVNEGEKETRGGAALIIPQRSHSGTWQIQAWDGISKSSHYNAFMIASTLLVAGLFVLIGFLLYQQQLRSLKLSRQRVSFVNQVSHELGSPLTNISLNLDLARDSLDSSGGGSKNVQHRLGLVAQEIDRLNRLVGNVLTFSQSDRGVLEVNKETCFPDEVISLLLDSYRPALKRRGIALEYEPSVGSEILTDPDALTQIISNLISNVEKYAHSGKWLSVKTYLRDEELVVSVLDRGPGIPEDARERVFESFERVENSLNEGSSGAGLGLSIAVELARKLGGSLEMVRCEVGCHFELSIPIKENINV